MKQNDFTYEKLVSRNNPYITPADQAIISSARVLIAGCGIGSQVAEAAARAGFQHFILVDGDTIDLHNLNRQSFFSDQIGKYKVDSLKENIMRINPLAKVIAHPVNISLENVTLLVQNSDVIFDTIDFLDLQNIVCLHDKAHSLKKILISSFSVGFGAALITIPPHSGPCSSIRNIFNLPEFGDIGTISYAERYIKLFSQVAPQLDPIVISAMQNVFTQLADGKVCPAPQIIPGAQAVAAVCVSACIKALCYPSDFNGPEIQILNISKFLNEPGFKFQHESR